MSLRGIDRYKVSHIKLDRVNGSKLRFGRNIRIFKKNESFLKKEDLKKEEGRKIQKYMLGGRERREEVQKWKLRGSTAIVRNEGNGTK